MDIRRGLFFVGLAVLSLFLSSCDELRGPGGGEAHQRVQVSVSVRPDGSNALVNGLSGSGTAQFGTSLVVLAAAGTPQLANQDALDPALVYDSALLDMTTSTVTLNIPLGVSVQLFEYTFNDVLTLDQIQADPAPAGGPPNVSDPFTIATETTVLTVNVPLTGTSFQETFSGALNPELWQETGAVTSSGGILKLSTSTVFDAAATTVDIRAGDIARIRGNRNILLNSHRVAGTIAVDSFSVNENAGAPDPVRSRAQARLNYQPRDSRGDATNLTIVRLIFNITPSNTYAIRLEGGTCTGPVCATFVGFDAAHRATFVLPVGLPTANLPFSLEFIGAGVFQGIINGVTKTIDISDLGTFDANDFREVELRAQSHFAFDAGDTAAITATFTNIEVGDDGTAGNEGGPIRTLSSEYVYLSNQISGEIAGYTMDPATGFITADTLTTSGVTPQGIKVHPTGQFLYVALGSANAVAGFKIDPATNAITPIPGSPFAAGPSPTQLAFDPEGRNLYVANQAGPFISFYDVDPETGALSEHGLSPLVMPGVQASWVAMHPSGKFVYSTDGLSNLVAVSLRDPVTGALTPGPGPFSSGAAGPLGVTVHPNGDFLYVAHQISNVIFAHRLDTFSGALIFIVNAAGTPPSPVNLALTPTGDFGFVGAELGNTIVGYSINPSAGFIGFVSTLGVGMRPEAVSIDPSGQFLFIPLAGLDQFAVARINPGGSLTVVNQLSSLGVFPQEAAGRAVLR